ncbi:MAG: sulfatase-like hydrolase/transferase [Alphaproteobacteria bacterium]|nr:sulfatase-like hydrolase/transferase [Alphaproteobacteria bacterium]
MGKPNFLMFITDQQRADHLGCYGNKVLKTPNIDAIAAKGRIFERFYAANPNCMPNRASILTGRMPSAHGARHNGLPLSLNATTFVELLRAAGYKTGSVGKSHIQNQTQNQLTPGQWAPGPGTAPPDALLDARKDWRRGQDYDAEKNPLWVADPHRDIQLPYYGYEHVRLSNGHGDMVQGHYTGWLAERHNDHMELRGPKNAQATPGWSAPQAWKTSIPEEHYPTAYVREMALEYLDGYAASNIDDPFFLFCSFPDPHHPFTPPGKYWGMYDPAEIELPASFGQVGKDEPAFVRHLRDEFERGEAKQTAVYPFICGERDAREILALTYGMISMVDDAVGAVMAKLAALGLADDTVVIYNADHGDFMGDHSLMLKSGIHYDAVMRVPFIWSDPEDGGSGTTDILGSSIDIAPSILARAGLAPFHGMQGMNVVDAAKNGSALPRDGLTVEEDALGSHIGIDAGELRLRSYLVDQWRMTLTDGQEMGELYDRGDDPLELNNLWTDPAAATQKAEVMERWMRETIRLSDWSGLAEYQA